eukprot:GHVO01004251.1.p1 GENE.GHVO01004251.1~~GHVO01004251.1.p1  ORF type:complete len:1126 (+),score=179.55 GHVO01004251.1:298-3378(+)
MDQTSFQYILICMSYENDHYITTRYKGIIGMQLRYACSKPDLTDDDDVTADTVVRALSGILKLKIYDDPEEPGGISRDFFSVEKTSDFDESDTSGDDDMSGGQTKANGHATPPKDLKLTKGKSSYLKFKFKRSNLKILGSKKRSKGKDKNGPAAGRGALFVSRDPLGYSQCVPKGMFRSLEFGESLNTLNWTLGHKAWALKLIRSVLLHALRSSPVPPYARVFEGPVALEALVTLCVRTICTTQHDTIETEGVAMLDAVVKFHSDTPDEQDAIETVDGVYYPKLLLQHDAAISTVLRKAMIGDKEFLFGDPFKQPHALSIMKQLILHDGLTTSIDKVSQFLFQPLVLSLENTVFGESSVPLSCLWTSDQFTTYDMTRTYYSRMQAIIEICLAKPTLLHQYPSYRRAVSIHCWIMLRDSVHAFRSSHPHPHPLTYHSLDYEYVIPIIKNSILPCLRLTALLIDKNPRHDTGAKGPPFVFLSCIPIQLLPDTRHWDTDSVAPDTDDSSDRDEREQMAQEYLVMIIQLYLSRLLVPTNFPEKWDWDSICRVMELLPSFFCSSIGMKKSPSICATQPSIYAHAVSSVVHILHVALTRHVPIRPRRQVLTEILHLVIRFQNTQKNEKCQIDTAFEALSWKAIGSFVILNKTEEACEWKNDNTHWDMIINIYSLVRFWLENGSTRMRGWISLIGRELSPTCMIWESYRSRPHIDLPSGPIMKSIISEWTRLMRCLNGIRNAEDDELVTFVHDMIILIVSRLVDDFQILVHTDMTEYGCTGLCGFMLGCLSNLPSTIQIERAMPLITSLQKLSTDTMKIQIMAPKLLNVFSMSVSIPTTPSWILYGMLPLITTCMIPVTFAPPEDASPHAFKMYEEQYRRAISALGPLTGFKIVHGQIVCIDGTEQEGHSSDENRSRRDVVAARILMGVWLKISSMFEGGGLTSHSDIIAILPEGGDVSSSSPQILTYVSSRPRDDEHILPSPFTAVIGRLLINIGKENPTAFKTAYNQHTGSDQKQLATLLKLVAEGDVSRL